MIMHIYFFFNLQYWTIQWFLFMHFTLFHNINIIFKIKFHANINEYEDEDEDEDKNIKNEY